LIGESLDQPADRLANLPTSHCYIILLPFLAGAGQPAVAIPSPSCHLRGRASTIPCRSGLSSLTACVSNRYVCLPPEPNGTKRNAPERGGTLGNVFGCLRSTRTRPFSTSFPPRKRPALRTLRRRRSRVRVGFRPARLGPFRNQTERNGTWRNAGERFRPAPVDTLCPPTADVFKSPLGD
jgi:hypothetical protein